MQTLIYIIEIELLIALAVYLIAHAAVWAAMRFLTGGSRAAPPQSERR